MGTKRTKGKQGYPKRDSSRLGFGRLEKAWEIILNVISSNYCNKSIPPGQKKPLSLNYHKEQGG
jgi:hypothetical protein